jgi:hypothetical protein
LIFIIGLELSLGAHERAEENTEFLNWAIGRILVISIENRFRFSGIMRLWSKKAIWASAFN